ncbi:MAG: hypothetical protein K0Q48_172 [Bacillota bacterium]|jgi:hypothetical protein|nr:hypothetical protein [Bacillota bacterium]
MKVSPALFIVWEILLKRVTKDYFAISFDYFFGRIDMRDRNCNCIKVPLLRSRESPVPEYFDTYLKMNPVTGYLTFEVYELSPIRGRIPIPGAKVTVSKLLGDDYYLSKVMTTDGNGETEWLSLRTVSKDQAQRPEERNAFTNYYASVEAPGYQKKYIYDIQIFEGVTTLQQMELLQSRLPQDACIPITLENNKK